MPDIAYFKRLAVELLGFAIALPLLIAAPVQAQNIAPNSFAWSENAGWINFAPTSGPGVTVTSGALTGFAWAENLGWVNFNPSTGGVTNNGSGVLGGFAWSENAGWINFAPAGAGVTINGSTGVFSGFAWGENIGWINFTVATPVTTSWRATSGVAPVLVSAASRKVHGTAGTFDLLLNANQLTPSTETRNGPAYAIVFTFDKPVTAGSASVSESAAIAGTPSFNGNEMAVPLSGVINPQYVTVDVGSVVAADGGTGGAGSARIGFLFGDVSQNRQVTVADVGLTNAALLQTVTNANFLLDVNADGRLTVADKGLVNANLLKKLPAP